jgi:hypothetical protein
LPGDMTCHCCCCCWIYTRIVTARREQYIHYTHTHTCPEPRLRSDPQRLCLLSALCTVGSTTSLATSHWPATPMCYVPTAYCLVLYWRFHLRPKPQSAADW